MKGASLKEPRPLPRPRSFQDGSYPSSHRGNEVIDALDTKGGNRPSAGGMAVTCAITEDVNWSMDFLWAKNAVIKVPVHFKLKL